MEASKKVALGISTLMLLAVGARFYMIHRERVDADKPAVAQIDPGPRLTDDDMVKRRKLEPATLKDAEALVGKPVWVAAAGQLDYYPYIAHHADYAHSAGVLLGAEKLNVKQMITQVAPKTVATRIPVGDKQVLMVFTKADSAKEYAVPVGYVESGAYSFLLDTIFFYDDPHQMYKHWPADVWAAVDSHQAKPGMNELQTGLSLGQITTSASNDVGNRTVEYYDNGKPILVTFVNDKATVIRPTQQ